MESDITKIEALALEKFEQEDYATTVALVEIAGAVETVRPHVWLAYVVALTALGEQRKAWRAFFTLEKRLERLEASGRTHAALQCLMDAARGRLRESSKLDSLAPTRIDRPQSVA
jgi:hypothetical protein